MVSGCGAPQSGVLSVQHSGSVRYYGGRLTIRWDLIDRDWTSRAARGRPVGRSVARVNASRKTIAWAKSSTIPIPSARLDSLELTTTPATRQWTPPVATTNAAQINAAAEPIRSSRRTIFTRGDRATVPIFSQAREV